MMLTWTYFLQLGSADAILHVYVADLVLKVQAYLYRTVYYILRQIIYTPRRHRVRNLIQRFAWCWLRSTASFNSLITSAGSFAPNTADPATITFAPASAA